MYQHTYTQKQWLKTATPEQLTVFMAKGPATCDMGHDEETKSTRYYPMVRGIRLARDFDLPEAALTEANKSLRQFQDEAREMAALDEAALGLDGRNLQCLEQCEEHGLRIQEVFHLASVLATDAMGTSFYEPIDDFVCDLFTRFDLHESAWVLVPEIAGQDADLALWKDLLHGHWFKQGLFGFALKVMAPVFIELGCCKSTWVYAETYNLAFDLAIEWARQAQKEGA